MRWIITGANRGIGLALTKQLVARGEDVIATARDPERATELVATGCMVVPLDVRDPATVEAFAATLGSERVDVLVNNAGLGAWDQLGALDYDTAAAAFDTNALGPLRVTEAVLPRLGEGSRVVNITSRMGSIGENSSGGAYGYRMSKAALNMATSCLAVDLAERSITVVAVHPGWVKTDMGGAGALIETDDCATSILATIAGLGADDSGSFLDRDGASIAW